jgi:peptidoglycan/LPS O-acetylase OafA/YrhL
LKEPENWIARIDGPRTIAALLVLACHASALPLPCGSAGVWLSFVLSAFLLTKPFVYADETQGGGGDVIAT